MEPHDRNGDEGGIAIVLVAMMLVLIVGAGYAIRYGGDNEVSGQTRTAADAAALAGAGSGADWVVNQLSALAPPTGWSAVNNGLGQVSASQYASANGGTLESYSFSVTGRVTVTVSVPEGESGILNRETSAAQIALPVCSVVPPPPPSPTPSPTPTRTGTASPSPTPRPTPTTPPPPPPTRYTCSINGFGVHGGPFDPSSAADRAALRGLLDPRLVPVG
jgi:hypothetical protein